MLGMLTPIAAIFTAILALPPGPDIIRGCAPPADMCKQLEADCLGAGMDATRCAELAEGVCPAGRCLACDRAVAECDDAGLGAGCDTIADHCDVALTGCGCDLKCRDAGELTSEQMLSVCFAWPSALGDDCAEPSAGQCMAMLGWDGCGISSCEYVECMEALDALGQVCPVTLPGECAAVEDCNSSAGAPAPDDAFDLRIPPALPSACLELEEVFYRPASGRPSGVQWVNIKNTCAREVLLDEVEVRYTGKEYGWWFGFRPLEDLGSIGPGECMTVGGPSSSASNGSPVYDLEVEFYKPIIDPVYTAEGIGLAYEHSALPFDAVIYGPANTTKLVDENGTVGAVDVPRTAAGKSMRRSGGGWFEAYPAPNLCG
jgi:hypothetical protein